MINPGSLSNQVNNAIKTGMSSSVKAGNKNKSLDDRYEYDIYAMRAYCGDGFYCANYNYMDGKETLSYGKDVHWAYGGALINNEFPLSSRKLEGDSNNAFYIYIVRCTESSLKLKDVYKNFDITLYRTHRIKDGKYLYFYFTNLDYEIFNDLYDNDGIIINRVYYQDVGPLPDKLKELVKKNYKLKKQAPESEKPLYEMCFYGLFAMDIQREIVKKTKEFEETGKYGILSQINKLKIQLSLGRATTGLSGYRKGSMMINGKKEIRDKQEIRPVNCIIATWQTAFLRYQEWQLFKQYKDKVIYMNTDSIYTTEPIDTGEDLGLGHYGVAYDKKLFLGIRRNAYILLNEDGSFYKSTIGGVMDNYFTPQQIDLLRNGIPIKARSMTRIHDEKVEAVVTLNPSYIVHNHKL